MHENDENKQWWLWMNKLKQYIIISYILLFIIINFIYWWNANTQSRVTSVAELSAVC